MKIRITELRNSSVLRIYSERESIQTNPDYQRMGEIWTLEKRQLLIDSIINEFDIPKLYFHEFPELKRLPDGRRVRYAIIDGRQRLETIWSFIDGEFSLSSDFTYYGDQSIKAQGLTYGDISTKYPDLKIKIDSYTLPIILVVTDDIDMIEEMFSRLNEAVPLNAAERRNAIGGPMAKIIRDVGEHEFFKKHVPFSNKRYQHREVAAKCLLLTSSKKILDTKKVYLDNFVKTYKKKALENKARDLGRQVKEILSKLSQTFTEKDLLLKTQAMAVIYYLLFQTAMRDGWHRDVRRHELAEFEQERKTNRKIAEQDITKAKYDLLEFDRMSLQGSNDAASIRYRLEIIVDYFGKVASRKETKG